MSFFRPLPWMVFSLVITLPDLVAQQDTVWNRASLSQVILHVADAERTADWYRHHLGFQTDSLATYGDRIGLYHGDFSLIIRQPADYLPMDSIPKGPFVQFIEGYFKFGLLAEGFDKLVAGLREEGVELRGEVVNDPNLRLHTLILLDPAGNRVQLFGNRETRYNEEIRLRPFFFSIITNDLENSLEWYRSYLGMKEIHNLDMPDRNVFVRIMQGPDLLLELITIPDKVLRRKNIADREALQGIFCIGITPHPDDRAELFSILEGFGQLNTDDPNEEGWYPSEDGTGNVIWFR